MKHLGDITSIQGHLIEPVNCITFGSPCQDLSVAGKRVGLAGERSGLFMTAVKIIKQMRMNTFGMMPRFAVWENVPGAFSSNKGEDFHAVLEELARAGKDDISIPKSVQDRKGVIKWGKSGVINGDGFSIAWRTFDAQYWGVPQRRKRIAVVVDFGGQCAPEILFEQKGLRGHLEPCVEAWKNIARNPQNCSVQYDRVVDGKTAGGNQISSCLFEAYGTKRNGNGGAYLGDNFVMQPEVYSFEPGAASRLGGYFYNEISGTLSAEPGDNLMSVVTSGGFSGNMGAKAQGVGWEEEVSPTLRAGVAPDCAVGYVYEPKQMNCTPPGSTINTLVSTLYKDPAVVSLLLNDQGGASINGRVGVRDDNKAYTLNATDEHAITYGIGCYNSVGMLPDNPHSGFYEAYTSRTLDANGGNPTCNQDGVTVCADVNVYGDDKVTTLVARDYKGVGRYDTYGRLVKEPIDFNKILRWIVRRLTPTECERLQGFPDGWTDIGEWVDTRGRKHRDADSPRYKALGNSIALPQWWWITCKMSKHLPEHATLGSLFDGIGGFPLVWETLHGKGTARWASEIEEFPIAVTKKHFGEE